MCTEKNKTLTQLGTEKIAFPPKPYIRTDGHKVRRTDISNYREALLIKTDVTDGPTLNVEKLLILTI